MTQAAELSEYLLRVFSEGVPHDLIDNLPRLLSDVILGDGGTTVGANGIRKRFITLRLGDGFEQVMAALRAGKILELLHAGNPSLGDQSTANLEAQASMRFNNTISSWVINPFLINDLRAHESNAGLHIRSQPHGILHE
jgi:hypothetical protein